MLPDPAPAAAEPMARSRNVILPTLTSVKADGWSDIRDRQITERRSGAEKALWRRLSATHSGEHGGTCPSLHGPATPGSIGPRALAGKRPSP